MPLTIWCNAKFSAAATRQLREGLAGHKLIAAAAASTNVLDAGRSDPALAEADIALGQPNPTDCLR
ncbi:MAG TPA: D-2-hydroxyacid dehydrogenase, partial [Opitutaceae bacterium]|nr:D-2-hydroxyacid dehydrogenase [Opitutaceae bacterium]